MKSAICYLKPKLKGQLVSNLSKIAFSVVVLALATSGQAAVTLITPEEIPVLALDQQEVTGNFFRSSKTTYKLDPGSHDIAVRYEQLFNQTNGEHDILKSAVITVRANLEDNKTYRLSLVNPPKNYEVAQEYVKQPIIAVMDEQGQVIAQQQALNNAPKPMLGSSFFNRVMDFRTQLGNQKDYTAPATTNNSVSNSGNNSGNNSAMASTSGSSASGTSMPASSMPASSMPVTGSNTLEQLKQLWQQSTKPEREQFMQFIIR